MSLSTYQNLEVHFDTIDCSIFSGTLLEDAEAVAEMKVYLTRWANAINEHEMVKRKLMKQKTDCDFSVIHIPTGHITYIDFNVTHHPLFGPGKMMSPKSFQETAEFLIFTWNSQSPDYKYTLEKSWWNGER